MDQQKLDAFKAQLTAMDPENFQAGLPYNIARDLASDYDEFLACAIIIEEVGKDKGVSEETLVADRCTYTDLYFPQKTRFYVRDGVRHPLVLPVNASPEAENNDIIIADKRIHLNTGDYSISPDGVFRKVIIKGKEVILQICNHPIIPIGIQIERDGKEQVIIRSLRHGKLRELHYPKSVVYSPNKVQTLVDYDIDARKELSKYFSTIEDLNRCKNPDFKEYKTAYHLGWTDEHYNTFYPYYAQNYVSDIADQYPDEFTAIQDRKGNLNDWIQFISRIRNAEHKQIRIALAASFSSVLLQPMTGQPFILHIWGKTGSGKSTAMMTAAGVWGNPRIYDTGYVKSFNGTETSLVEYAGFCHSLPGCIDELQSSRCKGDFSSLVYCLCEGKSKGRSTSSGGLQRQSSWLNCFITTGEQPIVEAQNSMAGSLNRVIHVECPDNILWPDEQSNHEYYEALLNHYGVAGQAFISFLIHENNLDHAREVYDGYCRILSQSEATSKQAHEAAIILTADTLIDEWFFHDGTRLTTEDFLPFLQTKESIDTVPHMHTLILDWIISHTKQLEQEDFGKFDTFDGKRICYIEQTKFRELMNKNHISEAVYFKWAKESGKC